MTDDQREPALFAEMQAIDEQARTSYARMGLICQEVESGELYRRRIDPETQYPCRSLNRWILMCSPYSNGTAHDALRDMKELADVPTAALAEMTRSTIATMKQLSTKVRKQPAVIEAAKGDQFVAYLKEHHPEQHILATKTFRCPMDEQQLDDVEKAIAHAIERGCASKTEALWSWAIEELSKDDAPLPEVEDAKCGHA